MKGLVNTMQKNESRELVYQMTMAAAKSMLRKEMITKEAYKAFEQEMLKKYRPIIGGLFSDLDLQ